MSKAGLVREIEEQGQYRKVRVERGSNPAQVEVTGMRADQDWRYDAKTNTGGRRLIGYMSDLIHEYA